MRIGKVEAVGMQSMNKRFRILKVVGNGTIDFCFGKQTMNSLTAHFVGIFELFMGRAQVSRIDPGGFVDDL